MAAKALNHDEGTVGMRVQDYWGRTATVRWIGKLDKKDASPGKDFGHLWGIEYDDVSENKCRFNGTVSSGKVLFTCDAKKGYLCKSHDLYKEMNTESIKLLREKYGERVASWYDFELVKFCIARRFEMPKVFEMLDKHLAWREEFKPNPDEYFPPTIPEDYPAGYMGTADYDENLIYCERPTNGGHCHPSDFVRRYTLPVIARWHAAGIEMGIRRMRESNYHYARVCYIVDLLGVKAMTRPMIGFAQTFATVEQDNYPENLGRCFIVNCPAFFRFAWKLVKIFLDERTNKKINFCAPNQAVSAMKEVMPVEYIPSFCGGKATMWLETNGGYLGGDDPTKVHVGPSYVPPGATEAEMDELEEKIGNESSPFEEIHEGEFPTPTTASPASRAGSPLSTSVGSPNTNGSPIAQNSKQPRS